MNRIEIWSPKYMTDSVLIATYRVQKDNQVVFTKARHLEGKTFYISGEDIRRCPIVTNGKIACYDVPMSRLRCEERDEYERV